jgi:hypothetical protein
MTMTRSVPVNVPSSDGAPACPQCRRAMQLRVVEPVMFTSDLDDMTYRCENCDTEARRTVGRKQA